MEHIPTHKPDAVEAEFAKLNLDTGYTIQYLSGHNPHAGHYLFQPQIKSVDARTEVGYNLEPITSEALTAYADLLRKSLTEQGIDAEVIAHTNPNVRIEIILA